LVTQLCEGQRVTVLQLPVVHQPTSQPAQTQTETSAPAPITSLPVD
jgi:hypothetical protein